MMTAKKIIISLFFIFVILSFVSAIEVKKSEIVVITDPYQNLSVVIKDDSGADLQTFAGRARKFGEYRFTYYGVVSKIKISASIIDNRTNEVLSSKDFGSYSLGELITITLKLNETPESDSVLVNALTSQNNTNSSNSMNVSNATSGSASPITGRAIGGIIPSLPKTYYYVLAGFLGLGLLIFVLRKKINISKKSAPAEPDHQKMFDKPVARESAKEEFKPEVSQVPTADKSSEAQEIQDKISGLQKQLEQIRGEEKLIRLQRQIAREKDELRKLQDGNINKSVNSNNKDNLRLG